MGSSAAVRAEVGLRDEEATVASVAAADLGLLWFELSAACWEVEATGGDRSVRSRPVGDCYGD